MRTIDAAALRAAVPPDKAVEALERAFRAIDTYRWPQRSVVPMPGADMLLMPAAGPHGAGVKIVTVTPGNRDRGAPVVQAVYVLFSSETMSPVALIDGDALTGLRTAALSALATRYCARKDAAHLVVFGAGAQARAHIQVLPVVRDITEVTIVSRTAARAEALAAEMARPGLRVSVGSAEAVSGADIVCTCTTSAQPVFEGVGVRPGTHVNAVGAFRSDARETDDELIARAEVVVETRTAALAEAGDIAIPIGNGVLEEDDLVELADLVAGREVRRSEEDITFFKSVGLALEDLAVAGALREQGEG